MPTFILCPSCFAPLFLRRSQMNRTVRCQSCKLTFQPDADLLWSAHPLPSPLQVRLVLVGAGLVLLVIWLAFLL